MKDDTQAHPADALAIALDRANGLLGTLGQLFEPTSETFSGGNSFIAHALATTSAIVDDARTALEDLKYVCDLTLIDLPSDSDSVIEVNFQLDTEKNASADAASEAISDKHLDETESDLPHAEEEQIAQTYLELLRKLTAAEVFAAEQQALSVPGSGTDLLPLLRSLREDIQKIQNAA